MSSNSNKIILYIYKNIYKSDILQILLNKTQKHINSKYFLSIS